MYKDHFNSITKEARMSKYEILTLIFSALAYVFYIIPIVRSNSKPTLSTWISWLLMDTAVFFAMLSAHIFSIQMLTFVTGSVIVISVCLIKKASLGWQKLDTVCISIVVIAISIWLMSGDATLAIVLSLLAAIVGSVPMMANIWRDPKNEAMTPWIVVCLGSIFQLLSLEKWTMDSASATVTFLALQIIFIALISRKYFSRFIYI